MSRGSCDSAVANYRADRRRRQAQAPHQAEDEYRPLHALALLS